jgi:predicted dinucleotide-binding enzyme
MKADIIIIGSGPIGKTVSSVLNDLERGIIIVENEEKKKSQFEDIKKHIITIREPLIEVVVKKDPKPYKPKTNKHFDKHKFKPRK